MRIPTPNFNGARHLGLPTGPRIALYSHDTQGLGHIRRNLLVSRALCLDGAHPVILLLSGLREAAAFVMPSGVDCLTLPSLGKGNDGEYFPRSLGVTMRELIDVRREAIAATLRSFDPDVLIVDKVPRGVFDELMPSLSRLKRRGRTRIVLGLRDILDDPSTVSDEWERGDYERTIDAFYDRVWIYGDPRVYDTVARYDMSPAIAAKARYTGYLNPLDVEPPAAMPPPPGAGAQNTLCLVGGGRDGVHLATAFLKARLPGSGTLVTGPLMPADAREALLQLARARPNITMHSFVTDPCPLLARADRVIAMGGYNTICEILAFGRPCLIVPRIRPRTEQLIRAQRMAAMGLVELLHPDDLTPDAITAFAGHVNGRPPSARRIIDFDGVRRLPRLLEELGPARSDRQELRYGA